MKYFLPLFCSIFLGCGVFDSYDKDSRGYYPKYNHSCGPIALSKALKVNSSQISREIQDYNSLSKKVLSLSAK